jgi:hypothetical protein
LLIDIQLNEDFDEWFRQNDLKNKKPSDETRTHCRRELFHACWDAMLDEEFLHAHEHGILVVCGDGIIRRLYPRIFIYVADYPEKFVFHLI